MWLRLHWLDGHAEWVDHRALHVRPHWHLRMIAFYESKARKPAARQRADPEGGGEDDPADASAEAAPVAGLEP